TLASNADPIALTTIFNAPDFVPGWIDVTDATAKSNTLSMAFIGNVNTVALDASGETYNLERGAAVVHKFKPDMTPDGSFGVSVADHAMAVDPATGDVVTAGAFLDAYSPSGTIVGSNQEVIYSGNGIAAANRIPCMVSTSIVCLPDVAGFTNSVHAALADFSNTVAMTAANGHVTAYAYSRTPSKLCAFDVTPQAVTPGTCATLTGLSTAVNDEFQLAILGTGSSAALLDEAGKTLVFVDLASMTETKRASLQGNPMRIAADATHNDVVAAFADPAARLTRYAKVDPSAGTVTNLSSTSTLLSVGFAVKPDGTKLISCMRDKCEAVNNQ
ncbi:MAG TPA: hypothetical protein VMT99_01790, partial [Candidatus Paceibacterota bacterium]|nr:hypothetical protein [Candidatus Paceibacterota bacterium]